MRLDILDAHYVFAVLWHGGQFAPVYAYLGRLSRLGYRPGHAAQKCKLETPESRAAYRRLCQRHNV